MGGLDGNQRDGPTSKPRWDDHATPGGKQAGRPRRSLRGRSFLSQSGPDTGGLDPAKPARFLRYSPGLKPTYGRCSRYGNVRVREQPRPKAGPLGGPSRRGDRLQANGGYDPATVPGGFKRFPINRAASRPDIRGVRIGVLRDAIAKIGVFARNPESGRRKPKSVIKTLGANRRISLAS